MVLGALILRPLPAVVVDRVAEFARELCVDEEMIAVAREFASGSLGLAAIDFERNGYTASWTPSAASELHTSRELSSAWEATVDDPALAERWTALGSLEPGTLGRAISDMYQARGFSFPGMPGSAPPLLARMIASTRHRVIPMGMTRPKVFSSPCSTLMRSGGGSRRRTGWTNA